MIINGIIQLNNHYINMYISNQSINIFNITSSVMQSEHRGAMIRKINLFTRPVTLLLQREVGHRTYTGTCLTVAMLTILGIVLYGNIWSLILRDNPLTLISWARNQDDHIIPLQ